MQRVKFMDEEKINYMVSVPVTNQETPLLLRMWVAYDRGNRCSYYDYSDVKRGYYLFFSLEEPRTDYPGRSLSMDGRNCRLYLGEVKRQSEGWHKDFSNLAEEILPHVMKEKFADFEFDWKNMSFASWSGKGTGVGMYADFYIIFLAKKEWVFGGER